MNDAGSLSSKGRISNATPPIRVHAHARRSENPFGMAVVRQNMTHESNACDKIKRPF